MSLQFFQNRPASIYILGGNVCGTISLVGTVSISVMGEACQENATDYIVQYSSSVFTIANHLFSTTQLVAILSYCIFS